MKRAILKVKFSTILCGVGIIVFLILLFWTNIFHFNYRMNADIASEALLGRLIWESGQIVPDSWYPSTEIRILGTANIASIFYGLFGNMNLAMGAACVCGVVLIIFCVMFFSLNVVGGGVKSNWLQLSFLVLALPANYVTLEILYLFAGYYAVHTAVLFFTLGIYGGFIYRKKQMRSILALGVLLAFLLGMQGSRGLLVIYGPLVAVEGFRWIYRLYCKKKINDVDKKIGLWVLTLLLANYIGGCWPKTVNFGFSRNIRKGFSKLITIVIPDIVEVLGFDGGICFKVCMGILVANALYVLFKILFNIWMKKKITLLEWVYLVISASPIMTTFLIAFTTVESTGRYYFVFYFMIALSVVITGNKSRRSAQYALGIAIIYISIANIMNLYVPTIKSEEPPISDIYKVASYLKENDYTIAYASFENANTITVLSNGSVRAAAVASVEEMDVCKWLSCKDWYPPEIARDQTTAYVITEAEMPEFENFLENKVGKIKEIQQIERFHIFVSDYNYVNGGRRKL